MSSVNGCNIPDTLYYVVEKHVWAKPDGDLVLVGLTDVAQNMAKTVISVSLKGEGKPIKRGKSVATVESGKWVGPVPSPVEGEIVSINAELATNPGLINADPYGSGWIAKVKPVDWEADKAFLVTGDEGVEKYQEFLDSEGISCTTE